MRRRCGACLTLVAILSAVSTGCASIPETHYYMLELGEQARQHAPRNPTNGEGIEVGVEPFAVHPPYDQDQIVYRAGGASVEVGFYAYHRWAVPLSHMLPNAVAEALHGTPGIALIEPRAARHDYSAYLDGRVLALEEIDTPEGQTGYVHIMLTLRLPDGTRVWSDTLVGIATTRSRAVKTVVEQMQTALALALEHGRPGLTTAIANMRAARQ